MIIMSQPIIAWFTGPACGFPDWLKLVMIAYMVTMLFLFGRFFVASYMTPKPKSGGAKDKKAQ
jgi:hypothetical protein